LLGLLVGATIVFPSFSPGNLVAGLGITSVAVGFAFKDILENFFAGILLLWQKPFAIGDQIRTQSFEGTVVDIDIRSTRIKTADGEMVVMPNGAMISSPIVVLTGLEHRRVKMTVPVASASSIEDARRAILTVLNDSKLVAKDPATAVYRTSADTTNPTLDVYFWTGSAPEKMQQAVDEVAAALEQVFKAQPETKEIETADAARIKEVAPAQSKPEDSRRVA
jgi:small-conductance mechanosensitive channel